MRRSERLIELNAKERGLAISTSGKGFRRVRKLIPVIDVDRPRLRSLIDQGKAFAFDASPAVNQPYLKTFS